MTVAVPASAGIRVERIRTIVVFPAPFGPSNAKTWPLPMVRSTPSSTTFFPYDLRSAVADTAASACCLITAFMRQIFEP